MYQRLADDDYNAGSGELDTVGRPAPSAPSMDQPRDSSGYQAAFLRLIRAGRRPGAVVDLIDRVPGADWNFAYGGSGLRPLACLVSPDHCDLDQDGVVTVIDALVHAGASITAPAASTPPPSCLRDAAFLAASFGLHVVVRHLLDLGYPIDHESSPSDDPACYFATLLHAAASCGSLCTMELLVRRGIRCETRDALGRTALHVALDVAPDLDTCLFLQQRAGLDPFQPDHAGNTPFAMAVALLPDYAAAVLAARSRKHKQLKDGAIWKYDFRSVIVNERGGPVDFVDYAGGADALDDALQRLPNPLHELHPQPVRYTAIQLMVKHAQKQLLAQPMIKMALQDAWYQFARRAWRRQLGGYAAFLALFLVLAHLWPSVDAVRHGAAFAPLLYPLAGIVELMALRLTYAQLGRVWVGGRKLWAASPWNVADLVVIAAATAVVSCQLAVLVGFRSLWGPYWVNLAAVLHVVLGLKLLRFACIPKETGAMVAMIVSLMKEFLRFLVFFMTFYLPFASAYYLLFKEGDRLGFRTVMVTLCRWLFGDIEFGVFSERLPAGNVQTGQILFIFYMVVLGVALLNVLIALISNTFNAVIENAEGEWLLIFAQEIVETMATACSAAQIERYHRALFDKSGHPLLYEGAGVSGANWVQVLRERMLHLHKQQRTMASKMDDIHLALERMQLHDESGPEEQRFAADL